MISHFDEAKLALDLFSYVRLFKGIFDEFEEVEELFILCLVSFGCKVFDRDSIWHLESKGDNRVIYEGNFAQV